MTSWPSLATDLRNASATWVDTEVQVCTAGRNVLITNRKPDDLHAQRPAYGRVAILVLVARFLPSLSLSLPDIRGSLPPVSGSAGP